MPNYDLGTAEGKIVLDTSGVDNAVNTANSSLGRLGKGVNAERIGRDLTYGLTLPIVAAGGYALNTAVEFETAFAGVTKTVQASESQIADLRQGIIDMSMEIPASTTEIARVAEAAGQLGVGVDDIEEFTRVMVALGVATNLTSDGAAEAIARITNIMGTGVDDFDRLGAALVALGNDSAATESDILEMSNRIAGIANLSGSSEAEMLALAAAASSVGINAEAGGTAITKTIKDFDEWSLSISEAGGNLDDMDSKSRAFFELIGGSEGFAQFDQLSGIDQFDFFITKLQEAEAGGANLIGTLSSLGLEEIRQSDTILRLVGAGGLLSDTLALGDTAWESNTALTAEAEKRYATTASQLQILKNKGENAARIFGEALVPVLIDFVNAITPMVEGLALAAEAFGKLPEPVRKAVVLALGFLAVLGPIIFIGSKVVSTIQAFIGVFRLLGLAFSLNPIGILILAIAALVVGFVLLYKRSEKFRNFINGLGEDIQRIWGAIVDFFQSLPDKFKEIWDKVKEAFGSAADAVKEAWNGVKDFFSGIGSAIGGAFTEAYNAVVDFVTTAVSAVVDFFSQLPGVVGDAVSEAFDAFVDFLKKLPERAAYWLGYMIGRWIRFHIDLVKRVYEVGETVVTAVTDFMQRLPGIIGRFLLDAGRKFVAWGESAIATAVDTGVRFVSFLIQKMSEFAAWLPGFLAGLLVDVVVWGINLVSEIIRIGTQFFVSLVNALLGLPNRIRLLLLDIVAKVLTFGGDMARESLSAGKKFVDGLFAGIGDLVGLVKTMVTNTINAAGNLAQDGYNKMKSVGQSMWNGFKDGLGINSPSYVEEAAFAMRDNVQAVLGNLQSNVRTFQQIGRTLPSTLPSERFGMVAATSTSSAATATPATSAASSVVGWQQNGPLIGEATIRDERDIEDLARKLDERTSDRLAAAGRRRVLGGVS